MKLKIICLVGFLLLTIFTNAQHSQTIKSDKSGAIMNCSSVELLSRIEFVRTDNNQLVAYPGRIGMFYCDDYTVYQIPIQNSSSIVNIDRDGNEISETVPKEWTSFGYVIYHKNQPFVFRFDSLKAENPKKESIDTFLINNTFKNVPFYQGDKDSLVQSGIVNHVLIEKYLCKDKKDATYPDTNIYYYKPGFKNIDYSFSTKMDSIRKMKLFKVEYIYNESPQANGVMMPKRVWAFELANNDYYDKSKILNFVNRFREKENEWSKDIK